MKEDREEEDRRKKRRLKEAQALEAEDTLKLNEFLEWASKEKNKGEKRKRDPPQTEEEPHKKVCEEDLISWSSSEESGYVNEDSNLFV